MKKSFIVLSVALLGLFCSCSYNEDYSVRWDVFTVDIPSTAWVEADGYLSAKVDIPRLTRDVCDDGLIQCYLQYSDGVQTLLPTTRYLSYDQTDDNGNFLKTLYYSRYIDYEFSPGRVTVFYTMSDFYYDEDWPDDMKLRLVLQRQ